MAALGGVPSLRAQFARQTTASKGPRALGLLQLPPNGKGHLIPICIMVDGKFYDAAIYKATPVPMALDPGTVYEAERVGMPVGLFTVTEAAQANGAWLGAGTWLEAGKEKPSTSRKAESKPREEEPDKPPVLRRPTSQKPGESKPDESKPAETKPGAGSESKPGADTSTPAATGGTRPPAAAGETTKNTAPESAPPEDANRPRLRRGVPEQTATAATEISTVPTPAKQPPPAQLTTSKGEIQQIPAISDAGGPDPRPYTYELKTRELQEFRRKMLEQATAETLKRKQVGAGQTVSPPPSRKTKTAAKPQPEFEDVKVTVFDLSARNEPILVLSAKGHATSQVGKSSASEDYYVNLVSGMDLYGELRTIFFALTDEQHLDVSPRMHLIDAVDVDGDGRGELLFRQTSDAGSAYVVYRVTADRLVPLFEGSPTGR